MKAKILLGMVVWFNVAWLSVSVQAQPQPPKKALVIFGGESDPSWASVMDTVRTMAEVNYFNAGWDLVTLNKPTKTTVENVLKTPDGNLKAIVVIAHGGVWGSDVFFELHSGAGKENVFLGLDIGSWLTWMPVGQLEEVILHSCYLGRDRALLEDVFRQPPQPKFIHAHKWPNVWQLEFYWENFIHRPRPGPTSPPPTGSMTAATGQSFDSVLGSCEYGVACRETACANGSCPAPEDPNVVCALEHLTAGAILLCQGNEAAARDELEEALTCLQQVQEPDEGILELIGDIQSILNPIPVMSVWGLVSLILLTLTTGTLVFRRSALGIVG